MPDDLYDRDFVEWAETQAALLRRVSEGERVNAEIDWAHVIEEVHDLGLAEIHAVESLLRQAIVHLLKLHSGADRPARHWRSEVTGFLIDAQSRFTPAMRQRINLDRIYERALWQMRETVKAAACPDRCPWSLSELLETRPVIDDLLAKL